jgi:hypothetical protein
VKKRHFQSLFIKAYRKDFGGHTCLLLQLGEYAMFTSPWTRHYWVSSGGGGGGTPVRLELFFNPASRKQRQDYEMKLSGFTLSWSHVSSDRDEVEWKHYDQTLSYNFM